MGNPCRCPVCNNFGSSSLNGYCRRHVPKAKAVNELPTPMITVQGLPDDDIDPGYIIRDNYKPSYGIPRADAFIGGSYPTVKSTYGMQEKGGKKK
jgi:hypothetical protein